LEVCLDPLPDIYLEAPVFTKLELDDRSPGLTGLARQVCREFLVSASWELPRLGVS
jgi:hypothetical protein